MVLSSAGRSLLAAAVALAALALPPAASADVLDVYQRLAERRLSPAPLVPTVVPPSVRPLDRTVSVGSTIGGRGYALRILRTGRQDAIVVITGGEFRTMRALLRDHRRAGFGARQTRVRGRRGYVLTRRLGPVVRVLAWVEGGVVYSVGSGTPRKVSLAGLRSTARGLDRLEGVWLGGSSDPDSSSEGFAVTTGRTVTASVSFEATCAPPGSSATIVRAGQAAVTLLRRQGDQFTFDIAANRRSDEPWEGTVTGAIAPAAITLEVRATGTIDGDVCDSGPLTLTLDRRPG